MEDKEKYIGEWINSESFVKRSLGYYGYSLFGRFLVTLALSVIIGTIYLVLMIGFY